MSHRRSSRPPIGGLAFLLLVLPGTAAACAAPGSAASAGNSESVARAAPCALPTPFRAADFGHGANIDNRFLPMRPGTQKTYQGYTVEDGEHVAHTIVTTATDLYKEVDGVRSRVILEVDLDDGEVAESELAFFAQDDAGAVWNTGEYPEEYDNGKFTGAPSTWIAGQRHASAGIHMPATPTDPATFHHEYLQGRAPAVDFLDCASVASVGGRATVTAGAFTDVLTTYERSPLESETAIQTKEHAPGVGVVRIGSKNDPEGESMTLASVVTLSRADLERIDAQVRTMDRRAKDAIEDYRATGSPQKG
jgi:hypothetical protein